MKTLKTILEENMQDKYSLGWKQIQQKKLDEYNKLNQHANKLADKLINSKK